MFHIIAGIFGLNSMPIIWALVSRALQTYCKQRVTGTLSVFVDDFMGLSHEFKAFKDQSICSEAINQCFNNPNANALDKLVSTTHSTEILGWTIDLIKSNISLNDTRKRQIWF